MVPSRHQTPIANALGFMAVIGLLALSSPGTAQAQQASPPGTDGFLAAWDIFLKGCVPVVQDIDQGLARLPTTFPGSGVVATADRKVTLYTWYDPSQERHLYIATSRSETVQTVVCEVLVTAQLATLENTVATIRAMLEGSGAFEIGGGAYQVLNGTPMEEDMGAVQSGSQTLLVSGLFPNLPTAVSITVDREWVTIEVASVTQPAQQ